MQILFGFLLTVVFTERYASADSLVHGLHLIAVLLAVAATALLTVTAAWHRLLFRHRQREEIISSANWMAIGGLGCLAGATTATLGLIVDVVLGGGWALAVGVASGLAFLLLWFGTPLRYVKRSERATHRIQRAHRGKQGLITPLSPLNAGGRPRSAQVETAAAEAGPGSLPCGWACPSL